MRSKFQKLKIDFYELRENRGNSNKNYHFFCLVFFLIDGNEIFGSGKS